MYLTVLKCSVLLPIEMYLSVLWCTVSVLGQDEGYTVKYNPLPEGVPEGKAQGTPEGKGLFLTI